MLIDVGALSGEHHDRVKCNAFGFSVTCKPRDVIGDNGDAIAAPEIGTHSYSAVDSKQFSYFFRFTDKSGLLLRRRRHGLDFPRLALPTEAASYCEDE